MLIIRSYFAKKARKTTPKYAQEDVAISPTMARNDTKSISTGMLWYIGIMKLEKTVRPYRINLGLINYIESPALKVFKP